MSPLLLLLSAPLFFAALCPSAFGQETAPDRQPTEPEAPDAKSQPVEKAEEPPRDLFVDPKDGAFDASQFLSTRYGFLPIVMPITEPAVGYGLGVGLMFFHEKPQVTQTPDGPRVIPPIATFVLGMGTENGSWATGAGHVHHWNDGRIRYMVGGGYGSLNLDWFGRSDAFAGRAFSYNVEGFGMQQKLTFKLGESDFFAGPTQRLLATDTEFETDSGLPPPGPGLGILSEELDATSNGLGLSLAYDTRNSQFSPTRGTKAHVSWTQNDEAIGSDFDYGRIDAEVCQYFPLDEQFTLGLRVGAGYVGDDAPYYDLASIHLRGIQAGRYVDNTAAMFEAELRWDFTPRWTVVGFGGVGRVAEQFDQIDDAEDQWAGGVGFRYLIAREYDLRMGCDIAHGPEDWAFYVTIGTGWLRD